MSVVESGLGESASQFKSTRGDFASCSTYSTFPQVIDDTKGSTIGPLVAHHPKSVKRSHTDSGTVTSSDKKGNYWYVFVVA